MFLKVQNVTIMVHAVMIMQSQGHFLNFIKILIKKMTHKFGSMLSNLIGNRLFVQ